MKSEGCDEDIRGRGTNRNMTSEMCKDERNAMTIGNRSKLTEVWEFDYTSPQRSVNIQCQVGEEADKGFLADSTHRAEATARADRHVKRELSEKKSTCMLQY
jgi:hypothetical protein